MYLPSPVTTVDIEGIEGHGRGSSLFTCPCKESVPFKVEEPVTVTTTANERAAVPSITPFGKLPELKLAPRLCPKTNSLGKLRCDIKTPLLCGVYIYYRRFEAISIRLVSVEFLEALFLLNEKRLSIVLAF
jgi:hypothetical protein